MESIVTSSKILHQDTKQKPPDLNPLDYNLWSELENMTYQIPHRNLERECRESSAIYINRIVSAAIDQ